MPTPTASEIQRAMQAIDSQIASYMQMAKSMPQASSVSVLRQIETLRKEREELAQAMASAPQQAQDTGQGGGLAGNMNLPILWKEPPATIGAATPTGEGGGLPATGTLEQLLAEMKAEEGGGTAWEKEKFYASLGLDQQSIDRLKASDAWGQGQDQWAQQKWQQQFGYEQTQDTQSQQNWLQQWQAQLQQQAADEAYRKQALAQAWQIAQAQQAQRQKEMAAAIGQQVAQLQTQAWGQGLPYALPNTGQRTAPGFEAGGPMSVLAGISGAAYNPGAYNIAPNPAPSANQMMDWINQAMNQYGG